MMCVVNGTKRVEPFQNGSSRQLVTFKVLQKKCVCSLFHLWSTDSTKISGRRYPRRLCALLLWGRGTTHHRFCARKFFTVRPLCFVRRVTTSAEFREFEACSRTSIGLTVPYYVIAAVLKEGLERSRNKTPFDVFIFLASDKLKHLFYQCLTEKWGFLVHWMNEW